MNYVLVKQSKINFALGKTDQYYNKRSASFQYPTGPLHIIYACSPHPRCGSGILLWLTINLVCTLSIPVYQQIRLLSQFLKLCLHIIIHLPCLDGSSGSCHDKLNVRTLVFELYNFFILRL